MFNSWALLQTKVSEYADGSFLFKMCIPKHLAKVQANPYKGWPVVYDQPMSPPCGDSINTAMIPRKTTLRIWGEGGCYCKFNFRERLVNILIAHFQMYIMQVHKKGCYTVLISVSCINKQNCVFLSWLLDYSIAIFGVSPRESSRRQCSTPPQMVRVFSNTFPWGRH